MRMVCLFSADYTMNRNCTPKVNVKDLCEYTGFWITSTFIVCVYSIHDTFPFVYYLVLLLTVYMLEQRVTLSNLIGRERN